MARQDGIKEQQIMQKFKKTVAECLGGEEAKRTLNKSTTKNEKVGVNN